MCYRSILIDGFVSKLNRSSGSIYPLSLLSGWVVFRWDKRHSNKSRCSVAKGRYLVVVLT